MTLLDTKEGREDLIWALTQAATYPAFVAGLLEPSPGLPVYTQRTLRECFAMHRKQALRDIHDPAKLAKLMVSEGRRLGWIAYGDGTHEPPAPVFPCIDITSYDAHIRVQVWRNCSDMLNDESGDLSMPRARRILAQWLALPDGAREQAERVLRGESNG